VPKKKIRARHRPNSTLRNLNDGYAAHDLVSGDVRQLRTKSKRRAIETQPPDSDLAVPKELIRHPLLADRYFFAIPGALWENISESVGLSSFNPGLAKLEDLTGVSCGGFSCNVGFFRGRAVSFPLLHSRTVRTPPGAKRDWNLNPAAIDRHLQLVNARLQGFAQVSRAYLGWLLTNRSFLNEHDALLKKYARQISRWGVASFAFSPFPKDVDADSQQQFIDANRRFVDFFTRWRLQGLAAPYLPIPVQPLMTGSLPESILAAYLRNGGMFVIPDTFPIPSRDEFRNMLEGTLRSAPPEHLAEWMAVVAGNNTAKRAIVRFARLFELQHFWKVLYRRHSTALYRKTKLVIHAFASHLRVQDRMIELDLIEIRKRLGARWKERGAGLSVGPF
jgi:hypothetical protein